MFNLMMHLTVFSIELLRIKQHSVIFIIYRVQYNRVEERLGADTWFSSDWIYIHMQLLPLPQKFKFLRSRRKG